MRRRTRSGYHQRIMTRVQRLAIHAVVFLGGALLMALEVAAFRIISKTFGSALRETTAVIATFLASMSIGYWIGGRAGDRWPRPVTLIVVLLGAAALLFCIPWLDPLVSPRIAQSDLNLATHAFVATSALFALPTVLFAMISPIAIRLFASTTLRSGSNAGGISAVSTIGSIAGSVLTAFVLIDHLGSIARTVTTVGAAACATALLLFVTIARASELRRVAVLGALAAVLIAAPVVAYTWLARSEQALLAPTGEWRTLFTGDSPYHRVTVRERRGVDRFLTFSLGAQSIMRVSDPYGPGATYTDSFHIARFVRPAVRRVLVIGLGGGTAAKQYTRYYPDATVDAVEIDPLVVDVAKKYFAVAPGDRLRIHIADGRTFLRRTRETWDLIIVDAYTTNRYGDTLPAHLATREFFGEVRSRLSEGGIFHYHCAFGGKLPLALQKTAASVFRYTYATSGEILASDVPILTSAATALERARATPAGALPHLEAYLIGLQPYRDAAADIPLLTDDYAPVDTLR